MRKVLLATTALIGVALAGAAQAAASDSPISLNVGGYNDFVAGVDNGGVATTPGVAGTKAVKHDFEDEFKISFDAMGKASNGVEYGGNISLWNGPEASNLWAGSGSGVTLNSGYVWMSGAFGKVLFGDEHGASDLFVYAPTVGEGQIDGRYTDFISATHIASFAIRPSGFDNTEHSTKVTYYTPKVGNDMNKVQLGISYAPSLYDYGSNVIKDATGGAPGTGANAVSPYQDIAKADLQYTGNFKPVDVTVAGQLVHGGNGHGDLSGTTLGGGLGGTAPYAGIAKSFNTWGLGAQLGWNGWTFGGAYNSLGDYNVIEGQSKDQRSFNVGAKYEINKVGVALSWLHGKGYDNMLTTGSGAAPLASTNYVSNFNAAAAGATYTWFPGLTSNLDGVIFGQKIADAPTTDASKQGGYTVMVSQRLAF